MIKKTVENIKARVGLVSLVGILTDEFPVSFGNYFDFASGERCLNMWAENLEEFAAKHDILELECTVFSDEGHRLAFVTDKRVPASWLHQDLCVTGHGWGSREMCEVCCEFQGAPTVNRICGCEQPDESPHICQHYHDGIGENVCWKCKRRWPIVGKE